MNLLQFQFQSLRISTGAPFLNGASLWSNSNSKSRSVVASRPVCYPPVRAERPLLGRVICVTNDKTVNVVVYRLAKHPKYRKFVRYKKKYQAHDPGNDFQVGDMVQLEKCRPISKTKSHLAVKIPERTTGKQKKKQPRDLGIPLESDQQQQEQEQEQEQHA